jgi:hypothetical protein
MVLRFKNLINNKNCNFLETSFKSIDYTKIMRYIIEKDCESGVIFAGLVPASSLESLLPKNAKVHKVFPKLSYFIITALKYRQVKDLRQNRTFKDDYEVLVSFPVDYPNKKNLHYVYRIFNTDKNVIKWIQKDHLIKNYSKINFQRDNKTFDVRVKSEKVGLELSCKKYFPLPQILWKSSLFTQFTQGSLLSEFKNKLYLMPIDFEVANSSLGFASLKIEGLRLPRPLASCCVFIYNSNLKTKQSTRF